MARFFNTAGPCNPTRHYLLPPEARLPEVMVPIERDQFFVIHAPRQSGKTTLLVSLVETLRARGELAALASLDPARVPADVETAEMIVVERIAVAASLLPAAARPQPSAAARAYPPGTRLGSCD